MDFRIESVCVRCCLRCVPFSLRLPIAHISCTSMGNKVCMHTNAVYRFWTILFLSSFSMFFRLTLCFSTHICVPCIRFFYSSNFVCNDYYCVYVSTDQIFYASIRQTTTMHTAHNDRSWIWCVLRFCFLIFRVTSTFFSFFWPKGTEYEYKKMQLDSFSSLVMCQQFLAQQCQNRPIFIHSPKPKSRNYFHLMNCWLHAVFAYICNEQELAI